MAKSLAMSPNVVFLQPIGAGAAPTNDPPSGDASAPAVQAPPEALASAATGSASPPAVDAPAVFGASQELCEKVNKEAILSTLGYGLGASLLALVLFIVIEKKMVSSSGVRLAIGVGIGALGASGLAFFDPAKSEQFILCLNDPGSAVYITLGSQSVARALAFGFAPALVLSLVLCVVARKVI